MVLANPPVNALGQSVRQALIDALAVVLADDNLVASVLVGKGRLFSAGADVGEFGDATRPPPHLREVTRAFDRSKKPLVAAIHGVAVGGALELAMACHYRVSGPGAELGLSEVMFGVIPGAGGTQLLPRLIGVERALEMITTGQRVNAREAVALGLIDRVIEGDLAAGALAFARAVADHRPLPRARQRDLQMRRSKQTDAFFDDARVQLAGRSRGAQAPLLAFEAVRAAVELPFEQGLECERDLWAQAAASPQSAAMRYAFRAERAAAKTPDLPGFVGSRMFHRYQQEANFLLEEGARPQQVDAAMIRFGMAMGPFAACDLAGLDVVWGRPGPEEPPFAGARDSAMVPQRLLALGRFGQKVGAGYYRYDGGDRTPHLDPEAEAVVSEVSDAVGYKRRPLGEMEIVERCLLAVINEGAMILDEGVALRASDIDVVWVNGYGFPRHEGGPMYHAGQVGLDKIHSRLIELKQEGGRHWQPSPLLARLAQERRSFGTPGSRGTS